MRYLYGPIVSRRLGLSLGVDLTPEKQCTYDCVYCQIGRTVKTSCDRVETVDTAVFRDELRAVKAQHPDIDYVTFSGSGEPTLHRGLDRFIAMIKEELGSKVKICVITNSSLLTDPTVRAELADADVIIPSLDSARRESFLLVNRPHPGSNVRAIIDGIAALRREVRAEIWLEIMLIGGVNDSDADFIALRDAVLVIKPHKVQINLPVRPSLEPVKMPDAERVAALERLLGEHVEVISEAVSRVAQQTAEGIDQTEAILASIVRHPASQDDISRATGISSEAVAAALTTLCAAGKVKCHAQGGRELFAAF